MNEEIKNQTEEQAAEETAEPVKETRKEKKQAAKLEEKIAQLEEEAAKQEDRYKRILAEYDNFRKRTQKEKETTYQDAQLATVAAFLPVLDNLERGAALETADEGVKLILKQFREILQKYHVEPCAEAGQAFDPNFQRRPPRGRRGHRRDRHCPGAAAGLYHERQADPRRSGQNYRLS